MISPLGLKFIREYEKLRTVAYLDQAGIPTIGYGCIHYPNGTPVKLGDICSTLEANTWMKRECDGIEFKLDIILRNENLFQNESDALVSLVYNIGFGAFKSSTLLKLLLQGKRGKLIENQWLRWDKLHKNGVLIQSKGLKARRIAEYAVFSPSSPS